jgi:hypothetical protein
MTTTLWHIDAGEEGPSTHSRHLHHLVVLV